MPRCKICNEQMQIKQNIPRESGFEHLEKEYGKMKYPDRLVIYYCPAQYYIFEYFDKIIGKEIFLQIQGKNFCVVSNKRKNTCKITQINVIDNKLDLGNELIINKYLEIENLDKFIEKIKLYLAMA